jgi:hypothetical protein
VGATGAKGDTGAQGIQGEKGEKGDTGAVGPQGPVGEGLIPGSLLFLSPGIAPPPGYVLLGSTKVNVKTLAGPATNMDVMVYVKQ